MKNFHLIYKLIIVKFFDSQRLIEQVKTRMFSLCNIIVVITEASRTYTDRRESHTDNKARHFIKFKLN